MQKCYKCGADMRAMFMGKDLGEQMFELLNRVTMLEESRFPGALEVRLEKEVARLTTALHEAEQKIERVKTGLK